MPKGFSDKEKAVIRQRLIEECKTSWQIHGYKKTSIDTLCQNIGISKGAFYIFFDSKETLFYQAIKQTQAQLYEIVENHLSKNQSKYGVAEALKKIYCEYCKGGFMYDIKSSDFQSFFNKLSTQQQNELNDLSYIGTKFMLDKPFLTLKIDEKLAISTLSVMLSSVAKNDNMLCDSEKVFEFMINNLVEDIFE